MSQTKIDSAITRTPRSASLPRKRPINSPELPEAQKVHTENSEIMHMMSSILDRLEKQDKKLDKLDKLDNIEKSIENLSCRIDSIEILATTNKGEIDQIKSELSQLTTELNSVKSKTVVAVQTEMPHNIYTSQVKKLKAETVKLKEYSQRSNLIFEGVREQKDEDCKRLIDNIIYQNLKLRGAYNEIDKAHRLGAFKKGKFRPIVVKFKSHSGKEKTYERRKLLAGSGIFINLHISPETSKEVNLLNRLIPIAKQYDSHARIVGQKLLYKGILYNAETVRNADFPTHSVHQNKAEDKIGFLGKLSPLSNFYRCDLYIDGQMFNCVEQYYQFKKASMCDDVNAMAAILLENDPAQIKQISKSISLPNGCKPPPDLSLENKVMHKALSTKFEIPELKTFLMNTGDKTLIECNAYDKYWSCGLALHDPRFSDNSKWTGKNYLGKMLSDIRSSLK